MPTHDGSPTGAPISASAWSRVLAVMERLALSSDLGEVLELINDSMRDCLNAERASVFRYDGERDELYSEQAHGVGTTLRFSAKSGLAGQAVQTRRIINVPDCYADSRFSPEVDRRTGFRTRAMLSVPLVSLDGRLEGVAQVLNKRVGGGERGAGQTGPGHESFSVEDEMIARALASQAAVAIRRAGLLQAERRKSKMENDLRIAREIQTATLPRELPSVRGYSVAAWLAPAEETAGDCYDVMLAPSEAAARGERADVTAASAGDGERVWLFVADAAGHGVGPALAVAQAQAMFRLGVRAGMKFETLLAHMNEGLSERLPVGMFVCAFLGVLDCRTHVVRFAAAGFSPVVRLRGGSEVGFELLTSTMPPLGVDEPIGAESVAEVVLGAGDALVVATDGVYEQPREDGSRARPEELLRELGRRTGERGCCIKENRASGLGAALREWSAAHRGEREQADDQTVLIVAREALPGD